jgi:hypothetical protein
VSEPEQEQRCPHCDTPFGDGQEYCLECGSRLPSRGGLVAVLGSGWRRRFGWYPGDWIWPALLALIVAAAAGAASALWLTDRSRAGDQTIVATSPAASSLQQTQTAPEPTTSTPTATSTTATTSTTETTLTAPGPPPPLSPARRLTTWPQGRSAWTIVLDSLPRLNGRAFANTEAQQALHLGLRRIGILDSSQFSSLHPGYYVVFMGIYGSQAEAQSAILDAHRRGFGEAYPRRIVP